MSFTRHGKGRGPRKGAKCECHVGVGKNGKQPVVLGCDRPAEATIEMDGMWFDACGRCAEGMERRYHAEQAPHYWTGCAEAYRNIAAEHEGEPWTADLLERAKLCEAEAERRRKELES